MDFHFSCPLPGSPDRRRIEVDTSGGAPRSDGSVVLPGLTDNRLGLTTRLAGGFRDFRNPLFTVNTVGALVAQLLPAPEDLVDQDRLQHDPSICKVPGEDRACAMGVRAADEQRHAEPSGTVRSRSDGFEAPTAGRARESRRMTCHARLNAGPSCPFRRIRRASVSGSPLV